MSAKTTKQLILAELPAMRRYANALTRNTDAALDLVQDSLARGIEKQHLWIPGTNLRAWLFTILHNQHVNKARKEARVAHLTLPILERDARRVAGHSDPSVGLLIRDLRNGLKRIRSEERMVLLLVGLHGLGYEDAAKLLNIPVGTVRSRLHRGRIALRAACGMEERTSRPGVDLGPRDNSYFRYGPRGDRPGTIQQDVVDLTDRIVAHNPDWGRQYASYRAVDYYLKTHDELKLC